MAKACYIHIPFCDHICSYCDFCKLLYQKEWIVSYLQALEKEIQEGYHHEVLDTLYIGGGTPSSLSNLELERLLQILQALKLSEHYEYTFECNIENIDEMKLRLLKQYGVNRISIGIETINPKLLRTLNRKHTKESIKNKIKMMKMVGYSNINVDLMYALPDESLEDVEKDIEFLLSLKVPHISTYSLILEPHTKLYIDGVKPIDEDLDFEMYQLIQKKIEQHGYIHYETSNYAKAGYESRHNCTYWNNEEYYGFGLGASGYYSGIRYENTRSLNHYLKGCYRLEEHTLSKLEKMQNEMILGLRKVEGVNRELFVLKYGYKIEEVFPIQELLDSGKLIDQNGFLTIPAAYQYLANEILIYFI